MNEERKSVSVLKMTSPLPKSCYLPGRALKHIVPLFSYACFIDVETEAQRG